jgi:hypothetical protein
MAGSASSRSDATRADPQQKTRPGGGFLDPYRGSGLDAEIGELVLELRHATTAVEQRLLAAGPGRMRGGSMSRFIVSPSLPQVERVWYSVPSVMTTLMVW